MQIFTTVIIHIMVTKYLSPLRTNHVFGSVQAGNDKKATCSASDVSQRHEFLICGILSNHTTQIAKNKGR